MEPLHMARTFDFVDALYQLKAGGAVARDGWCQKGMYLKVQKPDAGSKMTAPYIYITLPTGERIPWVATHADLLDSDWRAVKPLQQGDSQRSEGHGFDTTRPLPPRYTTVTDKAMTDVLERLDIIIGDPGTTLQEKLQVLQDLRERVVSAASLHGIVANAPEVTQR